MNNEKKKKLFTSKNSLWNDFWNLMDSKSTKVKEVAAAANKHF